MLELPPLPEAQKSIEALLIYNDVLKWLCGVLLAIVSILIVDRVRRENRERDEKNKEIERLRDQLNNERYRKD